MTEKLKKRIPSFVLLIFMGVLTLLFFVLPKEEYSSSEKRQLEEFPQFSWSSLMDGSLGSSIETYLSDHFPGRKFFVGLNAYYELYTGRNGTSGIYCGSDDYLISTPVEYDAASTAKNASRFRDFAEGTGLPAHFLLVPSTGYTMSNKLPAVHAPYHDDEIFETAQENLGDVALIDLRETFKENRDDIQLYYKTDHHLTTEGAYLMYTAFCEAAGLTPYTDYEKETVSGFYGTTYSRSGLWFTPPDDISIWQNGNGPYRVTIEDAGKEPVVQDSLFFTEHLQEDDKYPVFLDGNHSFVKIENQSAPGGKILVIKDSFAHCMATFLAQHYSEVYLVDMRYYRLPLSDLIAQEGIDELLFIYGVDNLVTDTNTAWMK